MLPCCPPHFGSPSPAAGPAVLLALATPVLAQPPSSNKVFEPELVGVGNLAALTFESTAYEPVTDLAFIDDLPTAASDHPMDCTWSGSGCGC